MTQRSLLRTRPTARTALLTFCLASGLSAGVCLSPTDVAAAPLRFAASEMPKPDPCLPFITETRDWLRDRWPDGVTFRYYTVRELEKAVQKREVDIVLSEAGVAALLRRDGARPMLTTVSRRHPNPERSQGSAIFVRTCFLEDLAKSRKASLPVRVIEPYNDETFACQRSTALYPNWTISSVPSLSATELRRVMEALFEMPPTSNGMYWSVAPSFSATEALMKELRIGPYEFLRTWTLRRLWDEYRWPIGILLLCLAALLIHTRRTEMPVEKRTKELTDAFRRENELKTRAREKEAELEQYQRDPKAPHRKSRHLPAVDSVPMIRTEVLCR